MVFYGAANIGQNALGHFSPIDFSQYLKCFVVPISQRQIAWGFRHKKEKNTKQGGRHGFGQEHVTPAYGIDPVDGLRSEEHTSELQSRPHLVCRLLLEKKKTTSS